MARNPLHTRAATMFYTARFSVIRDNLSPENKAKWDAWTYEQKAAVVVRLIRKGAMI